MISCRILKYVSKKFSALRAELIFSPLMLVKQPRISYQVKIFSRSFAPSLFFRHFQKPCPPPDFLLEVGGFRPGTPVSPVIRFFLAACGGRSQIFDKSEGVFGPNLSFFLSVCGAITWIQRHLYWTDTVQNRTKPNCSNILFCHKFCQNLPIFVFLHYLFLHNILRFRCQPGEGFWRSWKLLRAP